MNGQMGKQANTPPVTELGAALPPAGESLSSHRHSREMAAQGRARPTPCQAQAHLTSEDSLSTSDRSNRSSELPSSSEKDLLTLGCSMS